MNIIYEKTAMLTNTQSDKSVECEVDNIQENKSLDAFIATNKKSPSSYDMSGTIVVDGVKHRFGAYQQKASGKGKMPEGTVFYTFYRVEKADDATSFNPADLEA